MATYLPLVGKIRRNSRVQNLGRVRSKHLKMCHREPICDEQVELQPKKQTYKGRQGGAPGRLFEIDLVPRVERFSRFKGLGVIMSTLKLRQNTTY